MFNRDGVGKISPSSRSLFCTNGCLNCEEVGNFRVFFCACTLGECTTLSIMVSGITTLGGDAGLGTMSRVGFTHADGVSLL